MESHNVTGMTSEKKYRIRVLIYDWWTVITDEDERALDQAAPFLLCSTLVFPFLELYSAYFILLQSSTLVETEFKMECSNLDSNFLLILINKQFIMKVTTKLKFCLPSQ